MLKRIIAITALIISAAMSVTAAPVSPQKIERVEYVQRVDTILRTDTVITTQVLRRSDLIQRSEVIIRTDSIIDGVPLYPVGDGFVPAVAPSVPAPPQVVIVHDTVWMTPGAAAIEVQRDSVPQVPMTNKTDASEEWVTFRGDTIPTMLKERNLGRFDRGLSNHLYLPKGIWTFGVTASYGEFSTSNLEIFDLVSDVDFSGHIFAVRPYFQYTIRNNMAVGMRLAYTSGKARIDSFKVDIDEDMNFNLHDIMYRSETYSAAITYTQYYGIARRGRFGIFNEVELAFSSGNSDFQRPYNSEPRLTHTTTMAAALNFSPGLSVFIMDPVSFNISFGVFGFQLKNEKQTVNGEKMGSRFTSSANFRFNIFNINFGIAVNI
ncbi:MAG: hypothetical protein K2H46_08590 [Muribaculaceae bacterium]|nr:hypothetical protein [Muribaculaceae bacterium]